MTTPMFDVDEKENERIILEESARRQNLIDQAVKRFAPQFVGQSGVRVIHVYSGNASLRKAVREIGGGKVIVVEHCKADGRDRKGVNEVQHDDALLPIPDTADLVVSRSALNSRVEWLAARLKAQVVVLPEAESYLRARLDKQGVLVVVGADLAKAP